jgi:hypothetical protein
VNEVVLTAEEEQAEEERRAVVYGTMRAVDGLLDVIQDALAEDRNREPIPDWLWKRLGDLANQVGWDPDPPETYIEALDYAFALQEVDQGYRRPFIEVRAVVRERRSDKVWSPRMAPPPRPPRKSWWEKALEKHDEWEWLAYYTWQCAADDAQLYPTAERVVAAQEAWDRYWQLISGDKQEEAA